MIGFLNVYKPQNITSAKVVALLKKKFNINKIGHMGTLDPLASGILPIALGKATRMFDYFLIKKKSYYIEADFGYATPSLDLGTEVLITSSVLPTEEDIKTNIPNFLGDIMQTPPMYSAKKVNGKKAYDIARSGKVVELKPCNVTISQFDFLGMVSKTDKVVKYKFEVECSSGTYIRTLISDLAIKCGSLATVTVLERIKSGYFTKQNSILLDDLLTYDNLNCIIPIEQIFSAMQVVEISDNLATDLINGKKIKIDCNADIVFIKNNNKLVCVAENVDNYYKIKSFLLEN